MFAKFFLLCVLVVPAFAETRNYLVYRRDNFPQDRYALSFSPAEYKLFIDTGKKDINKVGGQPFRLTTYELNYDGKYALWNVTSDTLDEDKSLESMEKKGYIVLLSTFDVVAVDRGPRGIRLEPIGSGPLAALPTDYYAVAVSTP